MGEAEISYTDFRDLAACAQPRPPQGEPLAGINVLTGVESWVIQLQGLDQETAIRRLESVNVDMVVIDPQRSIRGMNDYATDRIVERIHATPGSALPRKRCIAYLNVGQAEDYRSYWNEAWRAPGGG